MAKITFSLQELMDIAVSNGQLPPEVVRTRIKGEKIHFVIKTNTFILPYIPASLSYVSFDGQDAIFKLTDAGSRVNKIMAWLQHALKLRLPAFVKVEYPKVSVDIPALLEEKGIRGIHVKDIVLEDGQFIITTCPGAGLSAPANDAS